jgi:hypothetical protein
MILAWLLTQCTESPSSLERPVEFRSDHLSLSHAADWFVDRDNPKFNPDQLVMVESKDHRAMVGILLYESLETAEALLESTIQDYRSDFMDWKEGQPCSSWGRFKGLGRRFEAGMMGIRYQLNYFITSVDGGIFLQVNEMVAIEDLDEALPGLEMIRSTLSVHQ